MSDAQPDSPTSAAASGALRRLVDGGAILIRMATMADVGPIVEMETLCFARPEEQLGERTVRALVRNRRSLTLVAAAAEGGAMPQCLGWAGGFLGLRSAEPWGRVFSLAVHPAARGRGLGQTLLEESVAAMTQRGARRVFLEVREGNPAINLYRRLGFEVCGSLEHYYGSHVHAYRMVKR